MSSSLRVGQKGAPGTGRRTSVGECLGHRVAAFLTLLLLFVSGVSWSDDRIALVVGNDDYHSAPLNNPINDARDVSKMLEEFDFEVRRLENVNKKTMERAVGEFSAKLGGDTIGLFYYAGHGLQVEGKNYLIPVDANIAEEGDVRWEAMPLAELLEGMRGAGGGLNLVLLDACRDNPYKSASRSLARGLSRVKPAEGTMIMYATEPGRVAADGEGRNGLFTAELLRTVEQAPDLPVSEVFSEVQDRVRDRTNGEQSPWLEGHLSGSFSFSVSEPEEDAKGTDQAVARPTAPVAGTLEPYVWDAAVRGGTLAYYEAYLRQYPDGAFSEIAKVTISELERVQRAATEAEEARGREQASVDALTRENARRAEIEAAGRLREREQAIASARARAEPEAETRREVDAAVLSDRAAATKAAQEAERRLSLSRDRRRGIQVALNAAGYGAGAEDGIWGARTRGAIKGWQEAANMPATGYLSEAGYRRLVNELRAPEGANPEVRVEDETVAESGAQTRVPNEQESPIEPTMIRIEGGKVNLSGNLRKQVSVSAFEIGRYEVTVEEFHAFLESSGYETDAQRNSGGVSGCKLWSAKNKGWIWQRGQAVGFSQSADHPVTCVSWNDAKAYVDWLNATTSGGFRLPSEAEWEYALSGGVGSAWSFDGGERELCKYGNGADRSTASELFWSNDRCSDGHERTAPVGSYEANRHGIHDMHGNVGEWIEDCWHAALEEVPRDGDAWTSDCDSKKRVMRGGSWYHSAEILQSKHRYWFEREYRDNTTGFRVAR